MKRNLFLLFALLLLSVQSFGQVAGSSFEMYVMNWRFGPRSLDYFEDKNIEVTNMLTVGSIAQDGDKNKVDPAKVRENVKNLFRNSRSGGKLILDWEYDVFMDLRRYPVTDSRFKTAEAEWRQLIGIVRELRPNVEIGIYGIPFRSWWKSAVLSYNPDGKYDRLLSLVDFIAPTVYLQYPDEEVGRERNLEYLRDNMDIALKWGKKLGKPVYPFFWARIHTYNKEYGNELIQPEVFAQYIKFLSTYSYNGYKASGVYWWEVLSKSHRLSKVDGLSNWAKGLVTDFDSYDALMVRYAATTVKALAGTTAPEPEPEPAPQQVVSYTLFDASTGKDIQPLSDGETLNLADLPTRDLNIRANTSSKVRSVVFSLRGEQSKNVTESVAPYDLMGDNGSWTPAAGNYMLKATPYSGSRATGTAGASLTVSFSVVSMSSASASTTSREGSFTLINADTDRDIQTLASGATINLAALPTRNLSIRYNDGSVGSVAFHLSGEMSHRQDESGEPYALFGDNNSDYNGWTPSLGSYTLKVTSGSAGTARSINFRVVNNKSSSIGVSLASNAMAASGEPATKVDLAGEMLTVYPVPATTVLYVDLGSEAAEGETTIQLSDLNGRVVLTKRMHISTDGRSTELRLEGISRGLYVLSVNSSVGRATRKVVVN